MRTPAWNLASQSPPALRIALVYVALAVVWILASDALATALFPAGSERWAYQTVKGTAFVLVTGAGLYLLLARRERQLAADRARIDLVMRQLPGLIWTTDRNLRITSVGGEIDGLAFDLGQLPGEPVTTVATSPERRQVLEKEHLRALGGEAADTRIHLDHRTFGLRIEPLRDEAGRLEGTVGLALELPPEAEDGGESLREAMSRSRWFGALGSLTLDVAHQIKNPLFALTAALDALEARSGDQPETARHRRILRQQVERIENLISGLQVYGRNPELQRQWVDLAPVLEATVARARPKAVAAGIELVLEIEGGSIRAQVDADAISGAVRRVILNAIDFSPVPGRVTVTLSAVSGDGTAGTVLISVLDQGPGFAAGDLERVFQPLFGRRSGGAGLGLAIAERLVNAHGGHISAANRDGGGACVTLRLPA